MKYKLSQQQIEALGASPWLTDRERMVFSLYYQRGWHIEDVAAELDVSRGTINNTLRAMRGKI